MLDEMLSRDFRYKKNSYPGQRYRIECDNGIKEMQEYFNFDYSDIKEFACSKLRTLFEDGGEPSYASRTFLQDFFDVFNFDSSDVSDMFIDFCIQSSIWTFCNKCKSICYLQKKINIDPVLIKNKLIEAVSALLFDKNMNIVCETTVQLIEDTFQLDWEEVHNQIDFSQIDNINKFISIYRIYPVFDILAKKMKSSNVDEFMKLL